MTQLAHRKTPASRPSFRAHEIPGISGVVSSCDIEISQEPMRKSLIFHCYPKRGEDWRSVCLSTFRFRDVFDGRVLVSITSGEDCDRVGDVVEWFAQFGPEVEYKIVKNDPGMGINTTFREQLRAIQNEPGIVFKSHTKGISHSGDPFGSWRDNMAIGCLSNVEVVERAFRQGYMTFGVYKTTSDEGAIVMGQNSGPCKTPWPGWHYPGAFFWFSPRCIPERFFDLPIHHYENEAFPCHMGPAETGFVLKSENLIFVSADIEPYFKELNRPLCEKELTAAAARGRL